VKPFVRFALDALYTFGFFLITTAGAILIHFLTKLAEQAGVDGPIVMMLKMAEWLIAGADCVGIVCGTAYSLYRFIDILRKENAPPSRDVL
jgi:hypothetical protein